MRRHGPVTADVIASVAHRLRPHHLRMLRLSVIYPHYADLAVVASLPLGTVKSRLNRARAALAAALIDLAANPITVETPEHERAD